MLYDDQSLSHKGDTMGPTGNALVLQNCTLLHFMTLLHYFTQHLSTFSVHQVLV
jgi:hypothetical protein